MNIQFDKYVDVENMINLLEEVGQAHMDELERNDLSCFFDEGNFLYKYNPFFNYIWLNQELGISDQDIMRYVNSKDKQTINKYFKMAEDFFKVTHNVVNVDSSSIMSSAIINDCAITFSYLRQHLCVGILTETPTSDVDKVRQTLESLLAKYYLTNRVNITLDEIVGRVRIVMNASDDNIIDNIIEITVKLCGELNRDN